MLENIREHSRGSIPPLRMLSLLPNDLCQEGNDSRRLLAHSRLPRGVRPRLEGKQRTPLSSLAGTLIYWSPLSGLKGFKPPLQFGEKTQDCSPGQAGKEGTHLARTGASQGFARAATPLGVFSRGTTRVSGSLSCGAREVRSPCAWRGGARPGSRVTGGD